MANLSKEVLKYHQKFIYFLLLNPENIFQLEDETFFFGQWGSAIYKDNTSSVFPVLTYKKSQFIANEVLEESRCSVASDIFSLGKIFTYLADKSMLSNTNESESAQLTSLIEIMTSKDDSKRPSLELVINKLENIKIASKKAEFISHSIGLSKSKI